MSHRAGEVSGPATGIHERPRIADQTARTVDEGVSSDGMDVGAGDVLIGFVIRVQRSIERRVRQGRSLS